jgi:hypothetical protein
MDIWVAIIVTPSLAIIFVLLWQTREQKRVERERRRRILNRYRD